MTELFGSKIAMNTQRCLQELFTQEKRKNNLNTKHFWIFIFQKRAFYSFIQFKRILFHPTKKLTFFIFKIFKKIFFTKILHTFFYYYLENKTIKYT